MEKYKSVIIVSIILFVALMIMTFANQVTGLGAIVTSAIGLGVIDFFIGIVLLMIKSQRHLASSYLIFGGVVFLIGFSLCTVNFFRIL